MWLAVDSEAVLTRLYEESLDCQKCQLKENPSSKPATIQNKLTEEEKRRMVVLYGNQSEEECDMYPSTYHNQPYSHV